MSCSYASDSGVPEPRAVKQLCPRHPVQAVASEARIKGRQQRPAGQQKGATPAKPCSTSCFNVAITTTALILASSGANHAAPHQTCSRTTVSAPCSVVDSVQSRVAGCCQPSAGIDGALASLAACRELLSCVSLHGLIQQGLQIQVTAAAVGGILLKSGQQHRIPVAHTWPALLRSCRNTVEVLRNELFGSAIERHVVQHSWSTSGHPVDCKAGESSKGPC